MILAALEFSLSEIAAGLAIVAMLGGAIVWALSTVFPTKKSFYFVKDKNEREIAAVKLIAQECNQRHELGKAPVDNMVKAIDELKDAIHELTTTMQKTISDIDKRVAVMEERQRPKLQT